MKVNDFLGKKGKKFDKKTPSTKFLREQTKEPFYHHHIMNNIYKAFPLRLQINDLKRGLFTQTKTLQPYAREVSNCR